MKILTVFRIRAEGWLLYKYRLYRTPSGESVLGIQIRIRMFFGLPDPDPDPLVRGMDSDRLQIRILPFSHKGVEQTEIMLAK